MYGCPCWSNSTRIHGTFLVELLSEIAVIPDVLPESALPVQPHHEPHLEGAEAAAEGDVPVAVVGDGALEEKQAGAFLRTIFIAFPH